MHPELNTPELKDSLLLIGPKTGETVMGVSVAFDLLSDYLNDIGGQVKEVNLTQPGTTKSAGRFKLGRSFFTIARVIESWFKMLSVSQVYLIVSTSVFGFAKDFLIILGAWLLRKRIVIHLHGGGYRAFYNERSAIGKWFIRWALNRTHRIIVLGELLRTQFDFLNDAEKIVVVPNGLAQPDGNSTPASPKSAPATGKPWKILYLSNLMETKGYYVLLEASQQLADSNLDFQVDFCGGFVESIAEGGGSSRATQLNQEFLRRLGTEPLKSVSQYHGTVSGDKKRTMLQDAHVLVLPTWYPWEGQPLSIIEAMACGTPVISSQHAGIPEQIVDGSTGWMLPMDAIDADHLAEKLETLMSLSDDAYQTMSQSAIDMYLELFTEQIHLANMLNVLNEK